jgi:lipopolysaccharide kinase (Kdo/WaaP) family protein
MPSPVTDRHPERSEGSGRGSSTEFAFPGWTGEIAERYRPADLEGEVRRLVDPAAALRTLHWGRNYLYLARLAAPGGPVEVVVKQFRRDAGERLRSRLRGDKAARSWRTARALLAAGVPTPEPILRIEAADPAGPSFYICRHLPGALEARYVFRAANAARLAEEFPDLDFPGFVADLGALVRRLHEAGFWHRDVSGGNLLLHEGAIHLLDLNRTRRPGRLTLSQRTRDLCRIALFRSEHQELLLRAYWGREPGSLERALYLADHHAFRLRNRGKAGLKGGAGRLKRLLLPRGTHPHIPAAPAEAGARDKVVWDPLSDQPHQHAGRLEKLAVRLADAAAHAEEAAAASAALPRITRRYRELKRSLHQKPVPWGGLGVGVRPWPEAPEKPVELIQDLGVRHALLRLHPWDATPENRKAEEDLARELTARGVQVAFALPQSRDLVRDPERWRAAVEEIAGRFLPYGRSFQIGQAINRSKWGIWTMREYVELARAAAEVLRRAGDVEIAGPAVIDFEYHVTAALLNLRREGLHFDAVSALLYVDRRGAPENRQAGFGTEEKVLLLKAIADTARNAAGRCWVTEVNWPLREGPHSPAGKAVSVDEETQADYLVRYYLLALGTGLLEKVYWWQLLARGYGLVDPVDPKSPRARPSFRALRTLASELPEGSRLERVLALPPTRQYHFRRPDGAEVVAAWSTGGPAKVALPREAVSACDRDGSPLPPAGGREVEVRSGVRYFTLESA